ncbi:hypothetical protein SAMN04515691_2701 [Leifsonia sp. 98AMF]|uniref:hypothetical protein n=1 Tax=unclassified Leifsonia TaxID=2663824 RepID=UPI000879A6ED|nr:MULTISPECIES: hypothetical protein [unclassified Leifsonia]SDH22005.1 hypothetical protein SAMN04515690_1315 [Leifsonia sp. 197AMF]SDJ16515.1 hypothetical protein SAMN04515684_2467 [Leifsonia sp. 466MF]SDJ51054.1 hypothetical protein SAMN04515683_0276 [Leifsonia sp. 157MF]SDN38002.1 hypothetical protein SAMN04515686_0651 [Leifsonia sp. 509MF]SEM83280.1 hypothetical protein SAMN04515685_0264 [Leifsonia sp. 467MF]
MRDDTSPQIGSYDVDAAALTGDGEPLVDVLARLGVSEFEGGDVVPNGWRVLGPPPAARVPLLIGAPVSSDHRSWSVGQVYGARDGAPARVSFYPHALPVRPSVAERRGGLVLRWPAVTRELADVDRLSIDIVNEGSTRWLPTGDTFNTFASIVPVVGGASDLYFGWTGDGGTVPLDPGDYARVTARIESGRWRDLKPGPHDIVAYTPDLRLTSEPLRVDLTAEVIEAHRPRLPNPPPAPHDPRHAATDCLRVLHAMQAGRDAIDEVVAAITDAPDDATALSRISALLECDTDAAQAVYAMQLRRLRVGKPDVLSGEIEALERPLSEE